MTHVRMNSMGSLLHPQGLSAVPIFSFITKGDVSELEKYRSPEVQKSCHYINDTLLLGTYAYDWTSELPDFSNFDTPSYFM